MCLKKGKICRYRESLRYTVSLLFSFETSVCSDLNLRSRSLRMGTLKPFQQSRVISSRENIHFTCIGVRDEVSLNASDLFLVSLVANIAVTQFEKTFM